MRWSGVRILFQAFPLNSLRTASYEVFAFSSRSSFWFPWHTFGTLNHNKSQKKTIDSFQLLIDFLNTFNSRKSGEDLFECAASVPYLINSSILSMEIIIKASHCICDVALSFLGCYTFSPSKKENNQ